MAKIVNARTLPVQSIDYKYGKLTIPPYEVDVEFTPQEQQVLDSGINADMIPNTADANNPLADKQYVNQQVATNSASFQKSYNLVTDLHLSISATQSDIATALVSAITGAGASDYCYVQIPIADATPTQLDHEERYKFNGTLWQYEFSVNNSPKGYVFDVSAYNNNAEYSDLSAALAAIPDSVKKGGMSVQYVQIPDHKYVQFRLMADDWSTNVADWQGVDDKPTPGSHNLVESGGVAQAIHTILTAGNVNVSEFIQPSDGNIHQNAPWAMWVEYYDVSDLSGYVKIKTTVSNSSASLYSLVDSNNQVISFSNKGTDEVNEKFVDITNGSVLRVQTQYQKTCSVEYFNNEAITKLFNDVALLSGVITSTDTVLPIKNGTHLITSGAVYNGLHRVLNGIEETGKYISKASGEIVNTQYTVFSVFEYDISSLNGYAHIKTTYLNTDCSLFSLQDNNGNILDYSRAETSDVSDLFVDISQGTKLFVTAPCYVEFFDSDAITKLFSILEKNLDIEEVENLEDVNIDISQYIQWNKRITANGEEVSANDYAYIKLPVSLFTVGTYYYFKGKSAQYVPGVVATKQSGNPDVAYGDAYVYKIIDGNTYININLNRVYNSIGYASLLYKIAEVNKSIYSKSQTASKIVEYIDNAIDGNNYNLVKTDCTFYINKRYVTSGVGGGPIDANGFVCARFNNIDRTKAYAADCISSQFVPGYLIVDENDNVLYSGTGSYYEYEKQVLPTRDSSTYSIILQAKLDTSDINEVSVRNILRLYTIDNIRHSYTTLETDDKFYERDLKIKSLENYETENESYKEYQNYWLNKGIAWFGTSIPEGGWWTGKPSYPRNVGEMLKVSLMRNEAIGGSCAANKTTGNISFNYWFIRLGHSVAQNIDLFKDAYTVDYTNQTVTTGPRTMITELNLTSVPTVSTYLQAVELLAKMVECSYQIRLVNRYLISDASERNSYLDDIFDGYEDELAAIKALPSSSVYQKILNYYDIGLIVWDHGHNDSPLPIENALFDDEQTNSIDTTDMTTWLGAMNTYMRLIMFYKPKMRVVQISDYYYGNTVKSQEQFARRWQIPYCEVWKELPYLYNRFKVTVRGYWDADGIWHDKGFTWTEPTNMSDTNIANYTNLSANTYELHGGGGYGTNTIGALKYNINPRQENGEWVWETNLSNIFMKDGLHPGSDYTSKCVELYSRVLVKFLKGV